jgi:DNA-binding LacI/PurR family transcriptional regulator
MRIGNSRVTAIEVAKKAGVSQPTVSLVLSRNPKARVAAETRARVLKVAQELGYRPNRLAQGLVRRRSYALGVIVPGFDNPVYAAVISGAEKVAAQAGYAVLLCEAKGTEVVQHLEALRDRQIDGVIIAGIAASTLPAAALDGLNVALINQPSEKFSTVGSDSLKAGTIAAEHLLSLGHRRLAYLGPADAIPAFRLRERGFIQALRAAGVSLSSELIHRSPATVAGGLAGMRALLALANRPTAVFCANDLMALGAHKACSLTGVELPRDLSLLGCDDIEMTQLVTPELSTIALPQRELGARAVRLLLKQIEADGTLPPASQMLPVKLVPRGSTGQYTPAPQP